MKRKGRLTWVDLGSGAWMLETSDGKKVQLAGAIPAELVGQEVEVTGKRVGGFGFAMAGPEVIEVASVTRS